MANKLHKNLSKEKMTLEEFQKLLKSLNYNKEQIEQLTIKFENGDVLEAQDQKTIHEK